MTGRTAMPRYYFHITEMEKAGDKFADVEAAVFQALRIVACVGP
jgi:hypothetical protein